MSDIARAHRNQYGVDSRKEYQRLYQHDYYHKRLREAKKDEQDKKNPPELMNRVFKFCVEALNKGSIELSPESYRRLATITDRNEWLTTWCDIHESV
jgi:hypothetical protein